MAVVTGPATQECRIRKYLSFPATPIHKQAFNLCSVGALLEVRSLNDFFPGL